jgi:hypothetical protein
MGRRALRSINRDAKYAYQNLILTRNDLWISVASNSVLIGTLIVVLPPPEIVPVPVVAISESIVSVPIIAESVGLALLRSHLLKFALQLRHLPLQHLQLPLHFLLVGSITQFPIARIAVPHVAEIAERPAFQCGPKGFTVGNKFDFDGFRFVVAADGKFDLIAGIAVTQFLDDIARRFDAFAVDFAKFVTGLQTGFVGGAAAFDRPHLQFAVTFGNRDTHAGPIAVLLTPQFAVGPTEGCAAFCEFDARRFAFAISLVLDLDFVIGIFAAQDFLHIANRFNLLSVDCADFVTPSQSGLLGGTIAEHRKDTHGVVAVSEHDSETCSILVFLRQSGRRCQYEAQRANAGKCCSDSPVSIVTHSRVSLQQSDFVSQSCARF